MFHYQTHFKAELPELEELPYFDSKSDAGIKLLRNVETKLMGSPQLTKSDQPIAHDMRLLKPTPTSKLETYVTLKPSLVLTVSLLWKYFASYLVYIYLSQIQSYSRTYTQTSKNQHGDLRLKHVFSVSPVKIDIVNKSRNE